MFNLINKEMRSKLIMKYIFFLIKFPNIYEIC